MHFCQIFLAASVLLGSRGLASNIPALIGEEPKAYVDGSRSVILPRQYPEYPEETQFRRYVGVDSAALSPEKLVDYDTDESVSVEDDEVGEGLYPILHYTNNSCAADSVLQMLLNLEFKPLKCLIDSNRAISNLTVNNAIDNIMKEKFGPNWTDPKNPEASKARVCEDLLKLFFQDLKTATVDFEILYAKRAAESLKIDIENLEVDLEDGEITEENFKKEMASLNEMLGNHERYIQVKLRQHQMTEKEFDKRVSPTTLSTPRSILVTLSRFQNTYFGGVLDAEQILFLFANMLSADEQNTMSFNIVRTLMDGGRENSVTKLPEIVINLDVNQTLSIREQIEQLGTTGRHTGIVSFRPDGMEDYVNCQQVTKIVDFPKFQIFKLWRTGRQFKRLRPDGLFRANFFSHRPVDVPLQLATPYNSVLRAVICYSTDAMPHYSVVFRDGDDSGNFFTLYDGVRSTSKIISERKAMQIISRKGLILVYQKAEEAVNNYIFSQYRPALNYPINITPVPGKAARNPYDEGMRSNNSFDLENEDEILARALQLSLFEQ